MSLADELNRIAALAAGHADDGESVRGVIAAEPAGGDVVYLCAFARGDGEDRSWLVLDAEGRAVASRIAVRAAVSIAAMCELAAETAGGGELEELRAQLVQLRMTEAPEGIEDAEAAALELERTIGAAPRVSRPSYLDEVGAAARRLEQALGNSGHSPFAAAMAAAVGAAEELAADIEAHYKLELL